MIAGQYAYLGTLDEGLTIIDISDPHHPARVSFINAIFDGIYQLGYREIALSDQLILVAGQDTFGIISVADPTTPKALGYMPKQYGTVVGIAVAGKLAYLSDTSRGIVVADFSDPAHPIPVGVSDSSSGGYEVNLASHLAFLCTGSLEMDIFDITNPKSPTQVGVFETLGLPSGVAIDGSTAFLSDGGGGVQIIDVSNPSMPRLTGVVQTPGLANQAALSGSYAFVADGAGGLLVLAQAGASSLGTPGAFAANPVARARDRRVSTREEHHRGNAAQPLRRMRRSALVSCSTKHCPATIRSSESVSSRISATASAAGTACVVTSTADGGTGTFRQCLIDSGSGGTISFDPTTFPPASPATIMPLTQLPSLTQANLTIDASNAGVIIDGSLAPPGALGLVLDSPGSVVMGLQILHFQGSSAYQASGVYFSGKATHCTLGGNRRLGRGPTGQGNVISANGGYSIRVDGLYNLIEGNLMGTDPTGSVAWGNYVDLSLGGDGNIVGGSTPGTGNVISGTSEGGGEGVDIGGNGEILIGNFIGTDLSGTKAIPNNVGIGFGGDFNQIGGLLPGEGNLISGNSFLGISMINPQCTGNKVVGNLIGTDVTGAKALGNSEGIRIEHGVTNNVISRNVISGNGFAGITISDSNTSQNSVVGNLIGTDSHGSAALGNAVGVYVYGTGLNRIGGVDSDDRNVISGNGLGISIQLSAIDPISDNFVLGNYVGTDVTGSRSLGNGDGISINTGSPRTFVGDGSLPGRNVISANTGQGVSVTAAGSAANFILGNWIGTDATGGVEMGNGANGVSLSIGAGQNFVEDNRIVANTGNGIDVDDCSENLIRRNSIFGNQGAGIVLTSAGNESLAAPLIDSATASRVSGKACAGCTVEVFSDAGGQGRLYNGSTVADPQGEWSLMIASGFLTGRNVTATATDQTRNTSAFSLPKEIPGAPEPFCDALTGRAPCLAPIPAPTLAPVRGRFP